MKNNSLITNYYKSGNASAELIPHLLLELIKHEDKELYELKKKELFKKLIFNYSDLERKLTKTNELKDRFIAIAAHDLRNPLVSLSGLSEILINNVKNTISKDDLELLTLINTISKDAITLLNDILDISIIERGQLELKKEKSNIKFIVEKSIKVNEVMAKAKQIEIISNIEETPDFYFDKNKILQATDNLINNSIKYSYPNSKVNIYVKQDDNTIKLTVTDYGKGISEENQVKLFNEFSKLNTKPTGGEKSTGLGLFITKSIVQAHNGKTEVKSKLQEGSSFSFILPIN